MDSLIVLLVNIGFGLIAGIASGVKAYKDKKAKKKEKKKNLELQERIVKLESEAVKAPEQKPSEPIETPSEDGYYKPENPRVFYAQ
jgi:cell division protein FtsB